MLDMPLACVGAAGVGVPRGSGKYTRQNPKKADFKCPRCNTQNLGKTVYLGGPGGEKNM
jgi:hypothetical protein